MSVGGCHSAESYLLLITTRFSVGNVKEKLHRCSKLGFGFGQMDQTGSALFLVSTRLITSAQ